MPIWGVDVSVAAQDAEDGDVQGGYSFAEHAFVGRGADAVQDHTSDPQLRVEGRVPVHHGRDRPRHRRGVYHEEDRGFEELRDVGGRGVLPGPALAVEETHHALHHRDVCAARAVGEEPGNELGAGEEGVEVTAWAAGSEGVVGGVYEVGADLEGGDAEAFAGQSGHQTGRDGGLAHPRVGASDDDARGLYHSMPFCPR